MALSANGAEVSMTSFILSIRHDIACVIPWLARTEVPTTVIS